MNANDFLDAPDEDKAALTAEGFLDAPDPSPMEQPTEKPAAKVINFPVSPLPPTIEEELIPVHTSTLPQGRPAPGSISTMGIAPTPKTMGPLSRTLSAMPREEKIGIEPPEGTIARITKQLSSTLGLRAPDATIEENKQAKVKASNIMAIADVTKMSPSFIEKNYDDVTQELGLRDQPTSKEMIGAFMTAGVAAGMMTNPLATAAGLASYMATKEAESLGVQQMKGEKGKLGQGRELSEFLDRPSMNVEIAEFIIPAFIAGMGIEPWFKKLKASKQQLVVKELDTQIRSGMTNEEIKAAWKDPSKREELLKQRGLTPDQQAEMAARGKTEPAAPEPKAPPAKEEIAPEIATAPEPAIEAAAVQPAPLPETAATPKRPKSPAAEARKKVIKKALADGKKVPQSVLDEVGIDAQGKDIAPPTTAKEETPNEEVQAEAQTAPSPATEGAPGAIAKVEAEGILNKASTGQESEGSASAPGQEPDGNLKKAPYSPAAEEKQPWELLREGQKEFDAKIKESKAAGNIHLDDLPAAVETLRGKEIYNVHDPKETGRVVTVSNRKDVVVRWDNPYSESKNSTGLQDVTDKKGNVIGKESWLSSDDRKDYVVGKPSAKIAPPAPPQQAKSAKPGTKPFIDNKLRQLGTIEAVNKYYSGKDPVSDYARKRAPDILGKEAALGGTVDTSSKATVPEGGGLSPATAKQPYEITRSEFRHSENLPKAEAIRQAILHGKPIVIATNTRAIKLTNPEHIRISSNGTAQIPSGRKWVALTDDLLNSAAEQAGMKIPALQDRVYHREVVLRAIKSGIKVPENVLAEYPELKKKIPVKAIPKGKPVRPPSPGRQMDPVVVPIRKAGGLKMGTKEDKANGIIKSGFWALSDEATRKQLVKMYGPNILRKNGMERDEAAEAYGYESDAALLEALKNPKQGLNMRTDRSTIGETEDAFVEQQLQEAVDAETERVVAEFEVEEGFEPGELDARYADIISRVTAEVEEEIKSGAEADLQESLSGEIAAEGLVEDGSEDVVSDEADNFFADLAKPKTTPTEVLSKGKEQSLEGMGYADTFGLTAPPLKKDTGVLTKNVAKAKTQEIVERPEVKKEPPAKEAADDTEDAGVELALSSHDNFMKRLRDGEATPGELKQSFNSLLSSKSQIIAEFQGMTKDALLKRMGGYKAHQYKSDKKDRVVEAVYRDMLGDFSLGESVSYPMDFSGKTDPYLNAIQKLVEATTADAIKSFADKVAKSRQDYVERVKGFKKSLENPETLDEFETFLRTRGRDALSPEQLKTYDELIADKARESTAEQKKRTVQSAGATVGAEIIETKHTRDGYDLFVVQLAERVDREVYNKLNSSAKTMGGWYSSFKGNGAVPGFQFKTKEAAEAFKSLAEEGDTEQADEVIQDRRETRLEEKEQKAVEKLRSMSESLSEKARESLGRERLANTSRRAGMADRAEAEARHELQIAETMGNIADAIEAGETKHLSGLRTKVQVVLLNDMVRSAKNNELRKNYPTYSEQEQYKGEPSTEETVIHLDSVVLPSIFKEHVKRMADALVSKKGVMRLAQKWQKLASSSGNYLNIQSNEELDELLELNKATNEPYSPIASKLEDAQRLRAMGIENKEMERAALREFIRFRSGLKQADKAKQLERSLVGKNVGLDFFPTPKELAGRMVEEADIQDGMSVLEPSAGNGNIAEAIRESGAEPDVVEQSSSLRNVLTAKNFNLVGQDFMDVSGKYDRIVMNPPFSKNQDIEHVRHAYDLLNPSGKLVAIMGEGAFFRSDKTATEFRQWLDDVGGTEEKLPVGTFNDRTLMATTGTNTRLVTIEKTIETDKGIAMRYPARTDGETPYLLEEAKGDVPARISRPIKDKGRVEKIAATISGALGRTIAPENLSLWERTNVDDLGKLGRVFQKKIIVFQGKGEDLHSLPGYFIPSDSKTIYLNAESRDPHLVILGHELAHALRHDAPDIYDGFASHVEATDNFLPFKEDVEATYGRSMSDDNAMEEYAAQFIGAQFVDPAFWENLVDRKPGIFKKIYDSFVRLVGKLKGIGFDTKNFFRDFKKAERSAVKAMADYAERQRGDFAERGSAPVAPEYLVKAILNARASFTKAKPHLVELGQKLYEAGDDFKTWKEKLRQSLGEAWKRFKERMGDIWQLVKKIARSERGAVGKYDNFGDKTVVDFSKDAQWHDLAYNEPTSKGISDLKKWIRDNQYATVRMYHGTVADAPIMEEGIKATSVRTAKSLQSRHGYVSLSIFPTMAKTFAEMAYPGKDIAVYPVEVLVKNLMADKDQLKNQRLFGERQGIGDSLAESIAYGHGAQVKGSVGLEYIRQAIKVLANQRGSAPVVPDYMMPQKEPWEMSAAEFEEWYAEQPEEDMRTTGIKNAVTLEEREAKGLSEVEVEMRRGFGQAFDEGKRLVDSGERNPRAMAQALAEKPRPLTAEESVMLIYDRMRLQNEHYAVMDAMEQTSDEELRAELQLQLARVEDDINTNDEASRRTGYEQGLGLAARRMMIQEDYSLAHLIQRARIAAGGEVPAALRKQLETLSKQLDEANKKLKEYEANESKREAERVFKELKKEKAIIERVAKHKEKKAIGKGILAAERQKIYKDLNKALAGLHMNIDPSAVPMFLDLARSYIVEGINSIDDIVGNIYDDLIEDWPEITRRDIRDAITGYGKTAKPNRDEIETQLREARAQGRLISAYEDAVSGEVPLRSGFQHDKQSDEVRELGRKVKQAMREAGIDSESTMSPEEQWRTSLESVKTRLKNQIVDLNKQLLTGEKTPNKIGIKYDEEADALKVERDRLKATLEEIEGKPQMSDEQRIKMATAAVERSLKEAERKVTEWDLYPHKTARPEDTSELKKLKETRGEWRKIVKSMQEGEKPLDSVKKEKERKAKTALASAERSIEEYERRINEYDLDTKKKGKTDKVSPELQAARDRRDELKAALKEMQDEAKPKRSPEEIALKTYKTRTANRIKELEEKLAKKDYSKKPRRTVVLDPEAMKLKADAELLKRDIDDEIFKLKLANRTPWQKVGGGLVEAINLSRAIKTSFDLSAVLRQGAIVVLAHPIRGAKSIPDMFKALRSEKAQAVAEQGIINRPNYPLYGQSGLYLSEHGQRLERMEEAYMSRLSSKIPGVGASQRAYIVFLNKLRADSFDEMLYDLPAGEGTPAEMKAIANFINIATGRGDAGTRSSALVGLGTVFFAPRLVLSRFQFIAGQPFYRGSSATRKQVAKEYARFLAGLAVIYGLSLLAGFKITFDPRSSDFGKIRIGNTRMDPLAGLSQTTVLMSRLISGKTTTLKGKTVPIRGEKVPYGSGNSADVIARFLRSKLSPVVGTSVDILAGKNVVGEKVTATSLPGNLLAPLAFNDIYDLMKEQGIEAGTAMAMLSIFGMGMQTFDEKKKIKRAER